MEDTKVREVWEAQVSGGGEDPCGGHQGEENCGRHRCLGEESHVEDTKVRELWEAQVSGEERAMWRIPK